MSGEFGPPPDLAHLRSEQGRSLIVVLREAVAPILANNILPHFTDHSVTHSDSVTKLVDHLAAPLQSTATPLTEQELIVLYAACYLHDIGLQHERAGDTSTVRKLGLNQSWAELSEETRREALRKCHHLISAEMVGASFRAESTSMGIQLTQAYEPSRIASLCEAHNLHLEDPVDLKRYQELTEDGPHLRMGLISGLLRTADILDESRRRARREREKTLLLPIESQTHWWRHYYTVDVQFNTNDHVITIWFDFPPAHLDDYSKVVPELQLPLIEAEFIRHRTVFAKYDLVWLIDSHFESKPYSDTEVMPDEVMAAMLGQLQARHLRDDESRREIVLNAFKEARPHVKRRLDTLREQKDSVPPGEHLLELTNVANELWKIGSKRSALMSLVFDYERSSQHLDRTQRVEIGTRLLEMILEEGTLNMARGWILTLQEDAKHLGKGNPRAFYCVSLVADLFARQCSIDQAVDAMNYAMQIATDDEQKTQLQAKLKELYFLQGDLRRAADI